MTPPESNQLTDPGISFPRYSAQPFPRYRFLPGRNPHPTSNPLGHSFRPPGQPEAPVHFHPPHEWLSSPDYLFGCDLYNHAYWWEAHEAWAGLWQLTEKQEVQGRFLQGLIQVSACHLKIHLSQAAGVRRLHESSSRYLDFVLERTQSEPIMGLDLRAFRSRVDEYVAAALGRTDATLRHDPATYPYVELAGHENENRNRFA